MKQLVIISGKGGTGKTIVTAAFAALAQNKVMADCDVDAADLHLLLHPTIKEKQIFKSGKTAFLNRDICIQCGKCQQVCRFDAVQNDFNIDPISCEGCAFCSHICPVNAITMQENITGEWYISETNYGSMVHAKLGVAEENTGLLVSLVRQKAKELAEKQNQDLVIVDGAPGVGCPVIACITGTDYALVVTEPTLSGLHDAKRVISVTEHFNVPVKLIINKYNLNIAMTKKIEEYCQKSNIQLLGKIGFNKSVVKAMVEGKTIIEYSDEITKKEIINIWDKLQKTI